jgi:hypothetical protein
MPLAKTSIPGPMGLATDTTQDSLPAGRYPLPGGILTR